MKKRFICSGIPVLDGMHVGEFLHSVTKLTALYHETFFDFDGSGSQYAMLTRMCLFIWHPCLVPVQGTRICSLCTEPGLQQLHILGHSQKCEKGSDL